MTILRTCTSDTNGQETAVIATKVCEKISPTLLHLPRLWNDNLHLAQLTRSLSHGWTEMKMQLQLNWRWRGRHWLHPHHQGGTTAGTTEHSSADLQGARAACTGQLYDLPAYNRSSEMRSHSLPQCAQKKNSWSTEPPTNQIIRHLACTMTGEACCSGDSWEKADWE
jgi:hypothetical protein